MMLLWTGGSTTRVCRIATWLATISYPRFFANIFAIEMLTANDTMAMPIASTATVCSLCHGGNLGAGNLHVHINNK